MPNLECIRLAGAKLGPVGRDVEGEAAPVVPALHCAVRPEPVAPTYTRTQMKTALAIACGPPTAHPGVSL